MDRPILFLVPVIILLVATDILLKCLNYLDLSKRKSTFLELIPPRETANDPQAAVQFFSILHRLTSLHLAKKGWWQQKQIISFEIVSTREGGIRFIVCIPKDKLAIFKRNVSSYLPAMQFNQTSDYLSGSVLQDKWVRVVELKLASHFAHSLKRYNEFDTYDPLAFITGAFVKPAKDDLLAFQLLLSPVNLNPLRRLYNERYISMLGGDRYKGQISDKLGRLLFQTDMRLLVVSNGHHKLDERTSSFVGSLTAFDNIGYQGLVPKRNPFFLRWSIYRDFVLYRLQRRLPSLSNRNNLLSPEEIAPMYHFVHGTTQKIENMSRSFSKVLPTPAVFKKHIDNSEVDLLLGENIHQGAITPLGLTIKERQRHIYVVGGTGNGKTTMLQYSIVQDIKNGKGVAVIDPHGDMAETLLRYIPKERVNDVVYFNPDDIAYPMGLNLLELQEPSNSDAAIREKDLVTESIVSVFRKIFSEDDSGGHRIEYILRNAVQTALTIEGATLFTVYDLLDNPSYRKSVVKNISDKHLANFWLHELGKAGDMQRVKLSIGITAKIGRFLFSASAKRVLSQPKSTIDFDELINTGKILICNFSKGLLGEDTSQLFGATVLAKLQLASLRRARINEKERLPFYVYVDEFQNFATPSFVQMLSEARKYSLYLVMAEQSTSQQASLRMVNTILANVGTVVCFRTGNPEDERLLLPLFNDYVKRGEIANLPAYHFIMRQSALEVQEPVSGVTVLLGDSWIGVTTSKVIGASRKNYATTYTRRSDENYNEAIKSKEQATKNVYRVPELS